MFLLMWLLFRRHQVGSFFFFMLLHVVSVRDLASGQRNKFPAFPERVAPSSDSITINRPVRPTSESTVVLTESPFSDTPLLATSDVPQKTHTLETNTSPAVTWKVVESDMLIPFLNGNFSDGVKYAAVEEKIILWSKDPQTGRYTVPISTPKSPESRRRLDWVKGYISRAANIEFRETRPSDRKWAVVTENPDESCWSTLGSGYYGNVSINLPDSKCTSIHMVLHEVLHLLGFSHEHERPDRPNYFTTTSFKNRMRQHTDFDPLSVMMYHASNVAPNADSEKTKFFAHRRNFMSTCDWNLLLTLYPGPNKPPKCRTNEIAKVLTPTPLMKNYIPYFVPEVRCHLYNELHFENGECVLPKGQQYPDLKKEFFSDDVIDLSQPGTKTKTKKRPRKKRSVDDSNSYSDDDENGVNSDLDLPVRTLKSWPAKLQFCNNYFSRNSSILQNAQCVSACLAGCKKYAPDKSLTQCIRESYSPCARRAIKNSLSLPISCLVSFVTALFYVSLVMNA